MDRRHFTGALLMSLGTSALAKTPADTDLIKQLAEIEKSAGGQLGVSILDTGSGAHASRRGNERFPMCSTFKFLAVAAVLARVDGKLESLERRVVYQASDLVTYSPVTEKHVGGNGMTVADLCEATMTLSDNTAGNLLLTALGGPNGLTAYLRSIGDSHTRLDRTEPTLNEARRGDPRDTTTPEAMLRTMQKFLLGDVLSPGSREQLLQWLIANKTGDRRIRAGLPAGWIVGDKTGSGQNNATNDIAILKPPGRAPILVAAYLVHTPASPEARNAALAAVGRAAASI